MTIDEQVRENTATITKLEVMHEGLMSKMDDHINTTKEFMSQYYKEDKPRFDSSWRFKKLFMKIFWLVITPIIIVFGYGLVRAGTHFMESSQ